jgi:hypothetical protein
MVDSTPLNQYNRGGEYTILTEIFQAVRRELTLDLRTVSTSASILSHGGADSLCDLL